MLVKLDKVYAQGSRIAAESSVPQPSPHGRVVHGAYETGDNFT